MRRLPKTMTLVVAGRPKLLLLAVAIALSGCGENPVITWSAQFPSPDGKWVATARTYQYSGAGNAYDEHCALRTRRPRGQRFGSTHLER